MPLPEEVGYPVSVIEAAADAEASWIDTVLKRSTITREAVP